MRLNSYLIALSAVLMAFGAQAVNEPHAGAIVQKKSSNIPKPEFSPGNMTDIMPTLGGKASKTSDQDIYFSADELQTNEQDGIILASGNVIVTRGKMQLTADKLWYDQKKDTIIANGNVILIEEDGSILYTDEIKLADKMTRAEVNKVKVIMHDESQIWADTFIKKANDNKQMRNASYTACDMCQGKSPLWKIEARKVTYDAEGQNINYNDAVMKIKDIPVFYTPFLTHPAPEVKRRSGILMASIGSSSYLGQYVQPTYFWNVSEQTDVLFSPYLTTNRDVIFDGQYRQYFYNGNLSISGSYMANGEQEDKTSTGKIYKRPEKRGGLFVNGRYEINDYWVSTLKYNYVSDVFYLKDLSLPHRDEPWLASKLAFERFEGRDYATIEGYYYKLTSYNLRLLDEDEYLNQAKNMPYIAPFMEYENISKANKYGAYFKTNISSASVYTENKEESQRLSMINSWELPYTSDYGEQYKFAASLKSDAYYVNDYFYNPDKDYNGTVGRVFPQLGMEWRLPFVRATDTTRQIVEPIVVAVLAPNNDNDIAKIPNADSADAEFDDTNILSLDRYAGYDRNDDGSRISYGFNWSSYGDIMGRTSAFIAQTYQFSNENSFMRAVDEKDKLSDYVGRVYAEPNKYLDLNYRYRLDKDNFDLKYSELGARIGTPVFNIYTSYIYLQPSPNSYFNSEERKELYLSTNIGLTRDWSIGLYDRIDLTNHGGSLEYGGNITYEDECLKVEFTARRYNYDATILDDDYEFGITFFFKTLGGFSSK